MLQNVQCNTVFPIKLWTPEKISGMFSVSRPIRCEMNRVTCWFVVKKKLFQRDTKRKLKISRRREGQLVVSYQVLTDPCCSLSVIFCGFISHLIGRKAIINIPEIFSGVHGFTGKTVIIKYKYMYCSLVKKIFIYQITRYMNPFLWESYLFSH